MKIFHHFNNSGSPSKSVPVFVAKIDSDPTYFRTVFRREFTKLSWKKKMPEFLTDVPVITYRELHFVPDGTSSHFSLVARRFLNRKFPGRWVGKGGPIAWPPRSPELIPLDLYLWSHL